ncbi:MAG: toll/interleukin-1 receptor domain-containing protein [Pirellulales bacterium]
MSGNPGKAKVFISYSRADGAFVARLEGALHERGYDCDFDRSERDPNNIAKGISAEDDWWLRLQEKISAAEIVLLVVSPESAASPVCDEEIAYARVLGKRVVPLLLRPIDFTTAPPRLAALNAKLSFVDDAGFDASLTALCSALDVDLVWHREAARLTELAVRWQQSERSPGLLLRQEAVQAAEAWAARRPHNAPEPSAVLMEYIDASGKREQADRRKLLSITGRAFVRPASQSIAAGDVDAGLRQMAAGVLLSDDLEFRLVPEMWRENARGVLASRMICALHGHSKRIRSIRWNSNATRAATAADDGTARIWSIPEGALLHSLQHDGGEVYCAEFSSSGAMLATSTSDNRACVWDVESGRKLTTLSGHTNFVMSVAFASQDRRLLTAAWDGAVRVWDTSTWECVATIANAVEHGAENRVIRVLSDGETFVTCGPDKKVLGWSVSGRSLWKLSADSWRRYDCTADGAWMAVPTLKENDVQVWDVRRRKLKVKLHGHKSSVRVVCISPNAASVFTGDDDGECRLWDVSSGKVLRTWKRKQDPINAAAFVGGGAIACAFGRSGARLLNASDGSEIILTNEEYLNDVTTSLDGKIIATAGWTTAAIWEGRNSFRCGGAPSLGEVESVDVSPNGAVLAGGNSLALFASPDLRGAGKRLDGHRARVSSVRFSPSGRLAVSGGEDCVAKLWDVASARPLRELRGHSDSIRSVDFDARSELVITASDDESIRVWSVSDGREVGRLTSHIPDEEDLRYTAARVRVVGDAVLTAGMDGSARLWRLHPIQEQVAVSANGGVFDVDCHLATEKIATGDADNCACVWNARSGDLDAVMEHEGFVTSVRFSTDGQTLVTGSDRTVSLWSVETGDLLTSMEVAREGQVWTAHLTDDGLFVITSADTGARIFDARTGAMLLDLIDVEEADFDVLISGTTNMRKKPVVKDARLLPGGKLLTASNVAGLALWDVSRLNAFASAPATTLAGALANGVGVNRARDDLLMREAPNNLYEALVERLAPDVRAAVQRAHSLLRAPISEECYRFSGRSSP